MGLTPKQEAFAKAYVETGNASEAYRRAYKSERMKAESVKVAASRLLDNANVRLTIERLQEEAAQRHRVTVDDLVQELEEARQVALACEKPQASAAVAAIMGKAKLMGYDVNRTELTGKDGKDLVPEPKGVLVVPGVMDEAAWEAMMAQRKREQAADGHG